MGSHCSGSGDALVAVEASGTQAPVPKRAVTLHFYREKGAALLPRPLPSPGLSVDPSARAGSDKWLVDPRGDDSPVPPKGVPDAGLTGAAAAAQSDQGGAPVGVPAAAGPWVGGGLGGM